MNSAAPPHSLSTRRKLGWVFLFYLAQGLPAALINEALPVYLRVSGVGLAAIGDFAVIGLAWNLKFLWSPLLDRVGTARGWIAVMLLLLAGGTALVPTVDPLTRTALLALLVAALAVASATQDIAIDGATVRLLEPAEAGPGNGVRVAAYRIAMVLGGGGVVGLAGAWGWGPMLLGVAAVFAVLALAVARAPLPAAPPHLPFGEWLAGMRRWVTRPAIPGALLFIVLYKLGDASMAPMARTFWVDSGLSLAEIGTVALTLGMLATIAGALVGGWLTPRLGLPTALLWLGLAQAASNLAYAAVASQAHPAHAGIWAAIIVEAFCAGLGTAPFLAYLMTLCDRQHAATMFAALSALALLTRPLAGIPAGRLALQMGYSPYFALTFLLALPGLALVPLARRALTATHEPSAP